MGFVDDDYDVYDRDEMMQLLFDDDTLREMGIEPWPSRAAALTAPGAQFDPNKPLQPFR
jgi:hypothetical protein